MVTINCRDPYLAIDLLTRKKETSTTNAKYGFDVHRLVGFWNCDVVDDNEDEDNNNNKKKKKILS